MHEAQEEARSAERSYERKRAREEDKGRIEDLVGPKESGREGMLEKKKMRREADQSSRNAKDDAFIDIDESTLMGGGDSFQARCVHLDYDTLITILSSHSQDCPARCSKKTI